MNRKSVSILFIFLSLFALLAMELLYIGIIKTMSDEQVEKKMTFVKLSGLPDLAIATESHYVRHRSLSNMFSIYKDDSSLREYSRATYAISHSHIKINNEK